VPSEFNTLQRNHIVRAARNNRSEMVVAYHPVRGTERKGKIIKSKEKI
jgi:hypothetical protein